MLASLGLEESPHAGIQNGYLYLPLFTWKVLGPSQIGFNSGKKKLVGQLCKILYGRLCKDFLLGIA